MNILDEIKKRFSGFKNSLFLLLALIISLRFAGADAESQPLKGRLEYASWPHFRYCYSRHHTWLC